MSRVWAFDRRWGSPWTQRPAGHSGSAHRLLASRCARSLLAERRGSPAKELQPRRR